MQLGLTLHNPSYGLEHGNHVSLDSTGNHIIIGNHKYSGNSTQEGRVEVYRYTNNNWVLHGNAINGISANERFGSSVSINNSGTRIAVGAPGYNYGYVRVYEKVGNNWVQLGADISGENLSDEFGTSVSLNAAGDYLAVGAPKNDDGGPNTGHTRIYRFVGNSWIQLGQDISGLYADDESGRAVALNSSGLIVAIGTPQSIGQIGYTRIFEYVSGNWIPIGSQIFGENIGDRSGSSIDINAVGDRVIIGAPLNSDAGSQAGHARVFQVINGNWVQIGNDIDGLAGLDNFGRSVSISSTGERIAIGAPGNWAGGIYAGQVRIFEYLNGSWVVVSTINGANNWHQSGVAVSLNCIGDRVGVGAPYYNYNAGHVKIYGNLCDVMHVVDTHIACKEFTWINGQTYYSSTSSPLDTLTSFYGCDSIIHLNLTINSIDTSVTLVGNTLTSNEVGGTYSWFNCNTMQIIPGATSISLTAVPGIYSCVVAKNGCSDTTGCHFIGDISNGFNNLSLKSSLYPNPSTGLYQLELNKEYHNVTLELSTIDGSIVWKKNYEELKKTNIIINQRAGIYILSIKLDQHTERVSLLKW